jgi:hypothetical protein
VRHVRILGMCLVAVFALGAMMATSALASKKPNLKRLGNCPVGGHAEYPAAENAEADLCVWGRTTPKEGGQFTVGPITVPLAESIQLQYGLAYTEGEKENEKGEIANEVEYYVPPVHGAPAITPTPEKVPGEPIAHITSQEQEELGWSEGLKYSYAHAKKSALKTVYENIELAGIPATNRSNLINKEGTAVEAPVKIKGENKWMQQLGDVCYIGSNAEPIVQHLTSGTSESPLTHEKIEGKVGAIAAYYEFELITITGNVLVDNTYPVPGASCTGPYSSEIAATIDKEFDIPQPAGASVTELKGELWNSTTELLEAKGIS